MKKLRKSLGVFTATVFLSLASGYNAFAQVITPDTPGDSEPGDLEGFITSLLQGVIAFGGLVAAVILVYNGYMYMTASGNEDKVAKATKGITYALIGLVICAVAFLIVSFAIGLISGASGD